MKMPREATKKIELRELILRTAPKARSKKRKPKKKSTKYPGVSLYDACGKIRKTKEDICDCSDKQCSGCFFPCDSCKSLKCGSICRVNRRFTFDEIEYNGSTKIEQNPLSQRRKT